MVLCCIFGGVLVLTDISPCRLVSIKPDQSIIAAINCIGDIRQSLRSTAAGTKQVDTDEKHCQPK